jgi:Gas vesicle synthesis protein GvpL/GvpF
MIHLYAIADGLDGLPAVRGIGGVELERRSVEELDVVVSEHSVAVDPAEEAVLAHAQVVEALMPVTAALLPARFGFAFEDDDALEDAVRSRATDLHASLQRVRGSVELGLRVAGGETADASGETTGRAYLEARGAEDRLGRELHDSLADHARAATRSEPLGAKLVLSGAYLVDPAAVEPFRLAVGELQAEHPALTFALTGPWPPYSFAGVSE